MTPRLFAPSPYPFSLDPPPLSWLAVAAILLGAVALLCGAIWGLTAIVLATFP